MRITVILPDSLLAEAKRYALKTGRPLTRLIEDSLRETLSRSRKNAKQTEVRLPSFGGGRLMPGVQSDDNAALREIMDGGDDPR
jgi:hypothetical protein